MPLTRFSLKIIVKTLRNKKSYCIISSVELKSYKYVLKAVGCLETCLSIYKYILGERHWKYGKVMQLIITIKYGMDNNNYNMWKLINQSYIID